MATTSLMNLFTIYFVIHSCFAKFTNIFVFDITKIIHILCECAVYDIHLFVDDTLYNESSL